MGGDLPKQFMELSGTPVLQRTLEAMAEAVPDIRLIAVLPSTHFRMWKELCADHNFSCPHTLVPGGMTRFLSVRNALEKVPDGAIAMVHDGVRPFVSASLVRKMLDRMQTCRALIPVLPVTDTLRYADCSAEKVVDRSLFVSVQTPQMFLSEDLKAAYSMPYDTRFTDDASVAQAYGIPLETIEGEKFNIKLTTPEDLVFAKAILSLKRP